MLTACPASCGACAPLRARTQPTLRIRTLHGPLNMPAVGLGTAGLGDRTVAAIHAALRVGYKLLDTAAAREWYKEDLVGEALATAPKPATDVWVTTKVHPRDLGFNATLASVEQSLQRLGRQQLHLVLLHYPRCWQELCGAQHVPQGDWHDSWRAVETLIQQGRVLAAGVSNFELHELVELWEGATIKPSVVQRFADPLHTDEAVRRWCVLVGVQYQAYSSLGTQEMMAGKAVNPVLSHHVIQHIADARGWTAVQVVLRWALQTGQAVLPRSSNPGHMADNLHVLQLTPLSETELAALDALGRPQARQ